MITDIWNDIHLLSNEYKNIITKYFPGEIEGKFIIKDNILTVDLNTWGIENFYIENDCEKTHNIQGDTDLKQMSNTESEYFNIHYENFNKIYDIAISIQIGNWNTFKKMEHYLTNFNSININFYFILIKDIASIENLHYLRDTYKFSVILTAENKGMDIGLFLISLLYIRLKNYNHDYLFKIHTKTDDNFRNVTLDKLFGSYDRIVENIRLLNNPNIGMLSGNSIYKYKDHQNVFLSNYYHLHNSVLYLYNEGINNNHLEFVAGTMFIVKFKLFNILSRDVLEYFYKNLNDIDSLDYYWYSIYYKININNKEHIYNDYMNNKGHKHPNNLSLQIKTGRGGLRDSMIEHAMERLFGYIIKKNNYEIV
jgi:hypothetical protein